MTSPGMRACGTSSCLWLGQTCWRLRRTKARQDHSLTSLSSPISSSTTSWAICHSGKSLMSHCQFTSCLEQFGVAIGLLSELIPTAGIIV